MATVSASAFSPIPSFRTPNHSHSLGIPIPSPTVSFRNVSASFRRLTHKDRRSWRPTILRAVEEEAPIPAEEEAAVSSGQPEQPVSVPVSPSDTLTMVFQVTQLVIFSKFVTLGIMIKLWIFLGSTSAKKRFFYKHVIENPIEKHLALSRCLQKALSWLRSIFKFFCQKSQALLVVISTFRPCRSNTKHRHLH